MALKRRFLRSEPLKDGETVFVVGGGPAGAFFAINLLKGARRSNRNLRVTIVEKKNSQNRNGDPWLRLGCNYCAGGISPRLHEILEKEGIEIPEELVEEEFYHIWIQGLWKNFPLKVPKNARMYSVFRGSLPCRQGDGKWGFDALLLKKAVDEGARILSGEVRTIRYDSLGMPRLAIKTSQGDTLSFRADFVAVSIGINAKRGKDHGENTLSRSIRELNPAFTPVKARKALIFELRVGRDYLTKYMNKEVYFIEYGSKKLPLEHIALVPKGNFLTIALIGKGIDKASVPRDTRRIVKEFLSLPHIRRILPHIAVQEPPIACTCSPWITVGPARFPFADRAALIGDAAGSRLYKDGLYSAHVTAKALAQTVLFEGTDKRALAKGYGHTVKWLSTDNRYGRWVFGIIRLTFGTTLLSRISYQAFAIEMKIREKNRRPLGNALWKIASGTVDYREVFREMFSFPVLRSILVGGLLVTVRNIMTEMFFGLKWGEYGRYPTVILREKRNYLKESIAAPLEFELDDSPEFERMYAIKIRAPADEIFEELSKFGDEKRHFFHLRFAKVRRVAGSANEVGSIIQYSINGLASPVDMRLVRCIPNKTLLYEVSEKFADRGKLLFDINPTKDGNNRFVIYTAFDFKKGKTLGGKILWKIFKLIFPAYVHDVVWNHALCSIKAHVER